MADIVFSKAERELISQKIKMYFAEELDQIGADRLDALSEARSILEAAGLEPLTTP